jgi:hypothetical protein
MAARDKRGREPLPEITRATGEEDRSATLHFAVFHCALCTLNFRTFPFRLAS